MLKNSMKVGIPMQNYSPWPPLLPPFSVNIHKRRRTAVTKNIKKKKTGTSMWEQVTKMSFKRKQVHAVMDPSQPAKQDGNVM